MGTAPSLATVARAAGVSAATVSRIANGNHGRASAQTIANVERIIATMGYRPNPVGRSLRRQESRIVAMLSPNLDNPAMAAIAASTEAALRNAGYVMVLCDTHDRPELQDEYLEAMRAQMACGYVLVSAVPSPGLHAAIERGETIVCVNRRNPLAPISPGSGAFVGIDNRRAGVDVAAAFLKCGIRDLAVIRPASMSSTISERIEGFLSHLAAHGLPAAAIRVAEASGPDHLVMGYRAVCDLVARHGWPRGLMCPSDLMAYAAYRHACETGRAIPAQTRIIGIDNNAFNQWIAPWLTSVEIPYKDFGAAVVEQLLARWRGEAPSDRILPHRLVAAADQDG